METAVSSVGIVLSILGGLMLTGSLVLIGRLFHAKRPPLAQAGILQMALETASLDIVLLGTMAFAFLLSEPIGTLAGFIPFSLSLVAVPCWAASRLRRFDPNAYRSLLKTTAFESTVVLGTRLLTLTFGLAVFPAYLSSRFSNGHFLFGTNLLPLVVSISVVGTIEFVFIRGILELISFVHERGFSPAARPVTTRCFIWAYRLVVALLLLVLALWVTTYIVYLNAGTHPNWVFRPPLFSKAIPGLNLKLSQPVDRTPSAMIAGALPVLICLLLGLFVALQRIPESAALLFAISCLIYGLRSLDVLPIIFGRQLWAVHAAAWLLAAPIQLDLAVVFPSAQILGQRALEWRRARRLLYGAFLTVLPIWIYADSTPFANVMARAQASPALVPWLLLGLIAGLFSYPLSCFLTIYILSQTWRSIESVPIDDETPDVHCEWAELVSPGRIDSINERVRFARSQLRTVTRGAVCAAGLFTASLIALLPMATYLGMSADWIIRTIFAILFLSIATAIATSRLWDIPNIVIRGSAWTFLAPLLPVLYGSLKAALKSATVTTMGLVAVIIITKLPIDWLSRFAYRLLFRRKWEWQRKLQRLAALISRGEPFVFHDILDAACPEGISAAWLLVPRSDLNSLTFNSQPIHHSSGCSRECRSQLFAVLEAQESDGTLYLGQHLHDWLKAPIESNADRILCIQREIARRELWSEAILRLLNKSKRFRSQPIATPYLYKLENGRIPLLVRFGGQNNTFGVFVLGANRYGDYYDSNDLIALAEFARTVSAFLAGSAKSRQPAR